MSKQPPIFCQQTQHAGIMKYTRNAYGLEECFALNGSQENRAPDID